MTSSPGDRRVSARPSRTAEFVALFRALETARPRDRRLFEDPYAEAMLGRRLRAVAALARVPITGRLVYETIDRAWPGGRLWVVLRTRFIDDLVRNALDRGAEQLVLLGAGLDTRAHRIGVIVPTPVFEIDEAAMLQRKRDRLGRALGDLPTHVRYVALDFETNDLADVLRTAGLRPDVPSVLVWEGVTSYLSADAVDATLRSVATVIAPESTIAFTYLRREILEGEVESPGAGAVKRAVRRAGEPFRFGLDPDRVGTYVQARGFELEKDRSAADLARAYLDPDASRKLEPTFYRIAVARRGGSVATTAYSRARRR